MVLQNTCTTVGELKFTKYIILLGGQEWRTVAVSIKHGLRTTDYGLGTGYNTRTEV